MRALLDVNVLIALLDQDHIFHKTDMGWLETEIRHGWASCPITQNGCIRIMSNPGYPKLFPRSMWRNDCPKWLDDFLQKVTKITKKNPLLSLFASVRKVFRHLLQTTIFHIRKIYRLVESHAKALRRKDKVLAALAKRA